MNICLLYTSGIAAGKHEGETFYTANALYKRDNVKAKSEHNPNKSVSDPTSSTLPSSDSDVYKRQFQRYIIFI